MSLSKILFVGAMLGCVTFARAETLYSPMKEYQAPVYEEIDGYVKPNLEGVVEASKLLHYISQKYPKLRQGEYETTQEFNERASEQESLFRTMNGNTKYMFKTRIRMRYNADTEVYSEEGSDFGYSFSQCYAASNTVFCVVGNKSYSREIYTGQNKFGASVDIEKTRSEDVAVSLTNFRFDRSSFYFSKNDAGVLKYDSFGRTGLQFNLSFYVPRQRARTFKSENLSVLFVGNIENPTITKHIYGRSPKIDSPHDDTKIYHGLQFKLTQILLCVDRTGEIIDRRIVE